MTPKISIAFQTDKRASEYIALAKLVNEYDFDRVTVYCDAPFHPSFPPLMLMAPHIQKAQIGVSAIPPTRIHPIDIAAQISLLADVAQAGVYVGVARGAWLAEHGMTEVKPAITAIRETIDIVRYLLEGRTEGYQGTVYQIAEGVRAPYPLPDYRIPILVGSWGQKLCALAGEIAEEVKVGGSANPDIIPIIQNYIADGEQKMGRAKRTVGVVMGAVSVIDEDREQARAMARRSVALYLPVVAPLDPTVEVDPELVKRLKLHADKHEFAEGAQLISDDLLEKFAFSGNPDDFINHAMRLFEAGASCVEFGTPHGLSKPEVGIRLLGEKVVPILRSHFH